MPLHLGTHAGHYDILAAIGQGGMGEMYQATDTNLGSDPMARAIRVLCALLVASTLPGPAAAQSRVVTEASVQEPATAPRPPTASLERIRQALQSERRLVLPGSETLSPWNRRPSFELSDDLDLVWGSDVFRGAGEPVRYGAPTHQEMMRVTMPRWFTEGRPSDMLGVATASGFALLPSVFSAIAGWIGSDEGDDKEP